MLPPKSGLKDCPALNQGPASSMPTSRRHGLLCRDIAQPMQRKAPLQPDQQQADLHGEIVIEKRGVDCSQRIPQRDALFGSHLMEGILKLQRLVDIEALRRSDLPFDRRQACSKRIEKTALSF